MPSSTWSSARPDKLTLVSNARWQHHQNPPGIRHVQPEQHEKSLGSQHSNSTFVLTYLSHL